jgi:hypothetical protein
MRESCCKQRKHVITRVRTRSISDSIFIGGMMPDLASGVQQSATIIEIRPFRGGWQCFEAPGVQPYWTGEQAKEMAMNYTKGRAKFGRGFN